MKSCFCSARFLLALFVILGSGSPGHAQAPGGETRSDDAELRITLDANSDGRMDLVILDRTSGAFRTGLQSPGGSLEWSGPLASGIAHADTATSARISGGGNPVLLISGADAGRINLLPPFESAIGPQSLLPTRIGVTGIARANLAGSTTAEDILVITSHNSPPEPVALEGWPSTGSGSFATATLVESGVRGHLHPTAVQLRRGPTELFASVRSGALMGEEVLEIRDPGAPGSPLRFSQPLAAPEARFAVAFANATDSVASLLEWIPGTSALRLFRLSESGSGFITAPPLVVTAPFGLSDCAFVPGPSGAARLLIVNADGTRAQLHPIPAASGNLAAALASWVPPSDGRFTGAVALGGLGFQLLDGMTDGRTIGSRTLRIGAGGSLSDLGRAEFGPLTLADGIGNVLLTTEDLIDDPTARVLARRSARAWTSDAQFFGGEVSVRAEIDSGPSSGLGSDEAVSIGDLPPETGSVLVNQRLASVSVFPLRAAEGLDAGSVSVTPEPGVYPRAIALQFFGPAGSTVRWRRPGEGWRTWEDPGEEPATGTAAHAVWLGKHLARILISDTTVEAFADSPAGRTRTLRVTYRFSQALASQSSLLDGVPDFVKLGLGLDPFRLPWRDPANPPLGGLPQSYLEEVLRFAPGLPPLGPLDREKLAPGAFELAVSVQGHNGIASGAAAISPGQFLQDGRVYPGTPLSVSSVSGQPITESRLAEDGPQLGIPYAHFRRLTGRGESRLAVLSAPRMHALLQDTEFEGGFSPAQLRADQERGREMATLVLLKPAVSAFTYTYNPALDRAANARAWVTAARLHYANLQPPVLRAEVQPLETLVLLAFERWLAEQLVARGELPGTFLPVDFAQDLPLGRITLTAYRSQESAVPWGDSPPESGVLAPDLEHLLNLERGNGAFRLETVLNQFRDALVKDNGPAFADLRAIAEDIYRTSALYAVLYPGMLDSPIDALRQFVSNGTLPLPYSDQPWSEWSPHPADPRPPRDMPPPFSTLRSDRFKDTFAELLNLIRSVEGRASVMRIVRITAESRSACTLVEPETAPGTRISLVDTLGLPWQLPGAIELPVGSRLLVTHFADGTPGPCGALQFEVLEAENQSPTLLEMPAEPVQDADGNLLGDSWELAHLGRTGLDPFSRLATGHTLLQAYLDGSDPLLSESLNRLPPVSFERPAVRIANHAPGRVQLTWKWPSAYASFVSFELQSSPDLNAWTTLTTPSVQSGEQRQVEADLQSSGNRFWRIRIRLR